MSLTKFPNGISSFGMPVYGSGVFPDPSGVPYFVDANVNASGSGENWDEAMSTLTAGLAASQAQVTASSNRAWARRNTVFYCGDYITETLTTAAQQTDVIGVGADTGATPRLLTNWTIATARSSFRIINLKIIPQSTDPGLTLPSAMHGFGLHYFTIIKHTSYTNSAQLLVTDCRDWVMDNVRILPDNAGALSTIGLNIAGTSYGVGSAIMKDCFICGTEGMNVVDTGNYVEGAFAINCTFKATNLAVDENSNAIQFINCNFLTAAAAADANGTGIVDIDAVRMINCYNGSADSWGPIPNLNALS